MWMFINVELECLPTMGLPRSFSLFVEGQDSGRAGHQRPIPVFELTSQDLLSRLNLSNLSIFKAFVCAGTIYCEHS